MKNISGIMQWITALRKTGRKKKEGKKPSRRVKQKIFTKLVSISQTI